MELESRELIEFSKFEEFIRELNKFAIEKRLMGKLDTPIKAMKSSIDLGLSEHLYDESDKNLVKLLDRIYKKHILQ